MGCVMSTSSKCPVKKPVGKLSYMGFTKDISWPKKLSTGRILHKPDDKSKVRNRRKRKEKELSKG